MAAQLPNLNPSIYTRPVQHSTSSYTLHTSYAYMSKIYCLHPTSLNLNICALTAFLPLDSSSATWHACSHQPLLLLFANPLHFYISPFSLFFSTSLFLYTSTFLLLDLPHCTVHMIAGRCKRQKAGEEQESRLEMRANNNQALLFSDGAPQGLRPTG